MAVPEHTVLVDLPHLEAAGVTAVALDPGQELPTIVLDTDFVSC